LEALSVPLKFSVVPSLRSEFGPAGAPIRISENENMEEGTNWDAGPAFITADELSLEFVGIFDWMRLGYRNMALYKVKIEKFDSQRHLENRLAIVEAVYVNIMASYDAPRNNVAH